MEVVISPDLLDVMADERMVEIVEAAMTEKLAVKRMQGRGGWHTRACSIGALKGMLEEHVEKGDMVDVLNIAGMILARQQAGY